MSATSKRKYFHTYRQKKGHIMHFLPNHSSLAVGRGQILGPQVGEYEISMRRHLIPWFQAAKRFPDATTFGLQLICPARQDEKEDISGTRLVSYSNSPPITAASIKKAIEALDAADVPRPGRVYYV